MVEMAKSFGLHEPEFNFDGSKTFVKAMNKCIDYPNWTLPNRSKNYQRHISSNGHN